jgi:hypothetical protein
MLAIHPVSWLRSQRRKLTAAVVIDMLHALFNQDFNPNSRAFITRSLAVTPAQYAIVTGRLEAHLILKTQAQTDVGISMLVYRVHILHFATALLRLDLIKSVDHPLQVLHPPHSTILYSMSSVCRTTEPMYKPRQESSSPSTTSEFCAIRDTSRILPEAPNCTHQVPR